MYFVIYRHLFCICTIVQMHVNILNPSQNNKNKLSKHFFIVIIISRWSVRVSAVEVYGQNETLGDLLVELSGAHNGWWLD